MIAKVPYAVKGFVMFKKDAPLPGSYCLRVMGNKKNADKWFFDYKKVKPQDEIKWLGKKGDGSPRAIVTWILKKDGYYSLKLYADESESNEFAMGSAQKERTWVQIENGIVREVEFEQVREAFPFPKKERVNDDYDDQDED